MAEMEFKILLHNSSAGAKCEWSLYCGGSFCADGVSNDREAAIKAATARARRIKAGKVLPENEIIKITV